MRSIIELHLDTDTASQSSSHGQSSRKQSSSRAKEKKLLSEIDVVGLLGTSSVGTYEVQCLLSRCQKFFESRRADHFPGLLASYHLLRRLFALLDELESQRQSAYSLEKEVNDMKKLDTRSTGTVKRHKYEKLKVTADKILHTLKLFHNIANHTPEGRP
ncbi:hypothetical protein VKT23_011590 [Stygiomarasmius scandens]|uniref:Uncharacterized protein n=1 Tax=Marasmiellus scandens TaxID=2682957 RepID=A0ABR1JBA0_9AGAR